MSQSVAAEKLLIGKQSAFPSGYECVEFVNIDATAPATFAITQCWFDNPVVGRDDVYMLFGYNFSIVGGRKVAGESAIGIQIESYVDGGTPIIEAHLSALPGAAGALVRPWSTSINIATGDSDISFQNRLFIVADMAGLLIAQVARNGANIGFGIGVQAIASVNGLQLKGEQLWENPGGSVDDKYWRLSYAGDELTFDCINDAYTVANTVWKVIRTAGVPGAMYILPAIGIGSAGDAFLHRTSASIVDLDSDGVGTYSNRLRLLTIDVQGADGAGAGAGTITDAPHAGNPDAWVPFYWQGTLGWVPWWHA